MYDRGVAELTLLVLAEGITQAEAAELFDVAQEPLARQHCLRGLLQRVEG